MNRVFDIEKEELKKYLDMHETYSQIAQKYGCSTWSVMQQATEYGLNENESSTTGDEDKAKQEVAQHISDTIANAWEKNLQNGTINDMLGINEDKEFTLSSLIGETVIGKYKQKARRCHPEAVCLCCGKQLSWEDDSIEVHLVDGDINNITLTNIMPLCHSCHKKYERKSQYMCNITKSFVFDACHYLPYHDRKCKFMHGHTYHMDITIKNKVLQETGMVVDFGKLKQIVNEEVIDKFDHGFLNEYIDYPTCEVMISWIWKALSKRLKGIQSIKVWETDGSYCELTSKDMVKFLQEFECDWKNSEV